MDFIKVSADKWHFEEKSTGKRFYPNGANFTFDYEGQPKNDGLYSQSLHILTQDEWRPEPILRALEGAAACNMNVMKVFITTPLAIANEQERGDFKFREMTPSFLERMDYLCDCAEKTGIYLSLTLSEWCMPGAKWFHEGGSFWGGEKEKADSFEIYREFWTRLATHLRDRKCIFAYNLAVELYLPAANWGAAKGDGRFWHFRDEVGNEPFRRWLRYKYETVEAVNEAWGRDYGSFDEICQPDIKWRKDIHKYTEPLQAISDFNDFKECTTYFFLKNQTDAIRAADPNHMITVGLHPDQPGIGSEGFAWKHCGIGSAELDNFDFLTLHVYTNFRYLIKRPEIKDISTPYDADEQEMTERFHECILYARFNNFGKPLMLEEFGHPVKDDDECVNISIRTVKELIPHVSGFQLWFLGSTKDSPDRYGAIDRQLKPNRLGREWAELAKPGGFIETELAKDRANANTVIKLDRLEANTFPKKSCHEKIIENWDAFEHPIDFVMEKNATLAKMKAEGLKSF